MVALVGDAPGPRDPPGARPRGQRAALLEPLLEVEPERRVARVGDVDHVDRAVRARLRARGAAGAGRLVDHDLAAIGVEPDRVVLARIDAALIAAGAARVDEVEQAELVAAEGQAAGAVALLAGVLALLAVDAEIELADPHHLARDRDALADEEVEDLLLDAGDLLQALAGQQHGAADAGLEERVPDRELGDRGLAHHAQGRRRGRVERHRRLARHAERAGVEEVALEEQRHVLAGQPGQRQRLDQRLGLALLVGQAVPALLGGAALGQLALVEDRGRDLAGGEVDDRRGGAGAQPDGVGDEQVAVELAQRDVAADDVLGQHLVGDAVEHGEPTQRRVARLELGW